VWSCQGEAIRCAQQCHAEGIEIIAIGFGSADQAFLQAVATSNENALFTDLTTLVSSFSKIAQVLTESGGGVQMTEDGKKKKGGLLSFFK
jgi:molecular chaperone DnaK